MYKTVKHYDKSYVYFMQRECDGLIKIGTTVNLPARAMSLRMEYGRMRVLGVIDGEERMESKIHNLFSAYRIRGYKSPTRQFRHELFKPHEALVEYIKFNCYWNGDCDIAARRLTSEPRRAYWAKKRIKGIVRALDMGIASREQIAISFDTNLEVVNRLANDENLARGYRTIP